MALGMEVGLSPGDFLLDGDPKPPQKGGGALSLIFDPFLLWPVGWIHQDVTCNRGRPQPRGLCIRWGPSPSPKKGAEPHTRSFPCLLWCGQTAGWIKMALGLEVVLGPGHIVLDGDPAPPQTRGHSPPVFAPFLVWPNGWKH